jgi:hypothetical protein
MMLRWGAVAILVIVLGPGPARAEVADSSATGFLVRNEVVVRALPGTVYAALVERIGSWWDSEHTFSGDARNLSLEAKPGGCLCERLPGGGGVRHLTVVYAQPGRTLRLLGPMGPLQAQGVAGSMTWALGEAQGSTKVVLSYSVGGYVPGGIQTMAGPVDAMLRALLLRLKSYVETGEPAAK